jgi:hypothetical protein
VSSLSELSPSLSEGEENSASASSTQSISSDLNEQLITGEILRPKKKNYYEIYDLKSEIFYFSSSFTFDFLHKIKHQQVFSS